ncbi:MAG: hypothetical protein WCK28_17930 [Burkholderiales bacterium]|jgi:hypothetical protein
MLAALEPLAQPVAVVSALLAAAVGTGGCFALARRCRLADASVASAKRAVWIAVILAPLVAEHGEWLVGPGGRLVLALTLAAVVTIRGRDLLLALPRSAVLRPATGAFRGFDLPCLLCMSATLHTVLYGAARMGLSAGPGYLAATAVTVVGAAAGARLVSRAWSRAERGRAAIDGSLDPAFDALARRDEARLQAMKARAPESLRAGPARVVEIDERR